MEKETSQRVLHTCTCSDCSQHPQSDRAGEHRRINHLVAIADERTRRLLAGFLAQQHGRGGVALLARITGLDRNTIVRGRHELRQPKQHETGRVRRPGGGRPRAEKKAQVS